VRKSEKEWESEGRERECEKKSVLSGRSFECSAQARHKMESEKESESEGREKREREETEEK
jgi:hypothetical protein